MRVTTLVELETIAHKLHDGIIKLPPNVSLSVELTPEEFSSIGIPAEYTSYNEVDYCTKLGYKFKLIKVL